MNTPPEDPKPPPKKGNALYMRRLKLYDKICRVCGAPASNHNYGVVSCESCKAFFRRNSLRGVNKVQCPFSDNCEMTMITRNTCKKCRLIKCFAVGMEVKRIEEGCKRRKFKAKNDPEDYSSTIDYVVNMSTLAQPSPIAQALSMAPPSDAHSEIAHSSIAHSSIAHPSIAQDSIHQLLTSPSSFPQNLISAIQTQFGPAVSAEILKEMISQLQNQLKAETPCKCTCSCGKYKAGIPIVEQIQVKKEE